MSAALDLGVVNQVTKKFKGAQIGAFPFGGVNITKELSGMQLAGAFGGVNVASGKTAGIQISRNVSRC